MKKLIIFISFIILPFIGVSDDYSHYNDDYEYASRIRRFHNPIDNCGYYDTYYTNSYYYCGNFIVYTYRPIYAGWWYWGWRPYRYYCYTNYWYTHPYSYYRYRYYSSNYYSYWNGYNNGYWNGYNDGWNDNRTSKNYYGHRKKSSFSYRVKNDRITSKNNSSINSNKEYINYTSKPISRPVEGKSVKQYSRPTQTKPASTKPTYTRPVKKYVKPTQTKPNYSKPTYSKPVRRHTKPSRGRPVKNYSRPSRSRVTHNKTRSVNRSYNRSTQKSRVGSRIRR